MKPLIYPISNPNGSIELNLAGRVEELDRWSSRWSSWSSRWLPPSSFACPVELRPCIKSFLAPHVPYAPNAPKDLFQRTKHAYKRSYSQKSEDCSRRSIENQRPNRTAGWPRNDVPRSAKTISVRLKSRPKSNPADHVTTRETSRGRPSHNLHATPRTTMPREPGSKASRPRNLLTYHGRCPSEPGRTSHVRPRNHRPIPSVRPRRPTVNHPATTVPTRPRPDCPADRPDRPSERRGRPEAVFEAQSAQFKPKAGADLARLGLAAFSYLVHYKYFFLAL
ncbi:unnamed protein product [Microthlaspi erraticum]|uniref:Uncharacterized protein n=1 Tax=Microthlaspi erraticum TaxID=1685480 RepID=A0A6D2J5B6_9BRAS|nr:unnamed protein product [Microthlaspi erraticum]